MRHRDKVKMIVEVMMNFRYNRAKAMLRQRKQNERLLPKELGRNAEADCIIRLLEQNR